VGCPFTNGLFIDAAGKALLKHIITKRSPASPRQLAQELSLLSLASDEKSLDSWCGAAMRALPKESALVRDGNLKVFNKIVGHAMKASRGRADPLIVRKRLLELIQSGEN
jgi:aspartyl-tRNA(Asn)/glutamyl-tRNA(Gln) amidotransferase subunit B